MKWLVEVKYPHSVVRDRYPDVEQWHIDRSGALLIHYTPPGKASSVVTVGFSPCHYESFRAERDVEESPPGVKVATSFVEVPVE